MMLDRTTNKGMPVRRGKLPVVRNMDTGRLLVGNSSLGLCYTRQYLRELFGSSIRHF